MAFVLLRSARLRFCIRAGLRSLLFAVCFRLRFAAENLVFQADAEFSLQIYARLIAADHTRQDMTILAARADGMRSLMHAQKMSDTMACTVQIVQSLRPQRFACSLIQLFSGGFRVKARTCQNDMPLEHRRIAALHLVGQRSERDRPRDIRRAVPILSAGIHKQEALRRERHIRLRRGFVMYDCPMWSVSGNRIKAQVIRALAAAFLCKTRRRRHLRNRRGFRSCLPRLHLLLQPVQKPHHRRAVPHMRAACRRDLRFILDCLHQHRRILRSDFFNLLRYGNRYPIADELLIQQNSARRQLL